MSVYQNKNITGCDVSIYISHVIQDPSISMNFKFHNGWKIKNKKRTVIETAGGWHNKDKKSFEKKILLLRNRICNVDSKQSKINEVEVKIIFTVESLKQK